MKESIQCQYLINEIDPNPTLKAKYKRTMTEQKRMWRVRHYLVLELFLVKLNRLLSIHWERNIIILAYGSHLSRNILSHIISLIFQAQCLYVIVKINKLIFVYGLSPIICKFVKLIVNIMFTSLPLKKSM